MAEKKDPKKKHPGGRPTKYQEKLCCQIARLGVRAGLTELQIAGEIGVSEQTVNEWKKTYPEFSEALKSSRIDTRENIEKSLVRRALGFHYKAEKPMTVGTGMGESEIEIAKYTEYCPANVTAIIYYLKHNWKEKYGDKLGGEGEALIKKLDSVLDGVRGELQK